MQIVYRVPAGMSVGYLQLLGSPFNQERSILVLAGNTEEGVTLAGNTLLQPELSGQLTGVFAVTNGTQVATGSGSSPVSIVGTVAPSGAVVVINTPVPVSADVPPVGQPPGWLFPVLIASGVAIVLIILLAIVSAVSRRRAEEAALNPSMTNGNRNGHSK